MAMIPLALGLYGIGRQARKRADELAAIRTVSATSPAIEGGNNLPNGRKILETGILAPEPQITKYPLPKYPSPDNKPDEPAVKPPSALPELKPLDYDPRYENAAKQNYIAQQGAIQGALSPIKEHHESLINQLNKYGQQGGYSGPGGGIAAATALGLVQNDSDQQAGIAKEEAHLMGALQPHNIDAMRYGDESRRKTEQELFGEKLPSKLAQTKLHELQSALGEINMNFIKEAKTPQEQFARALQLQGHGNKPETIDPEITKHIFGQKEGQAPPSISSLKSYAMGLDPNSRNFAVVARMIKEMQDVQDKTPKKN